VGGQNNFKSAVVEEVLMSTFPKVGAGGGVPDCWTCWSCWGLPELLGQDIQGAGALCS
jgi:hypothetical protein